MPFIGTIAGTYAYGKVRPPPTAASSSGGSLRFTASSTSGITIPNDIDLRMGTGDFTVEWFQYQLATGGTNYQRIFSMGSYPSATFAVSVEGTDSSRTFYAWISSVTSNFTTLGAAENMLNTWIHYAMCRSGSTFRLFKNGTQLVTNISNTTNFTDATNNLVIGNETSRSAVAAFNGYITNFHWVKGTALYTANFSRPTAPITAVANTKKKFNGTRCIGPVPKSIYLLPSAMTKY